MDDFDRRSAVLLCQRDAGTGRFRLLRPRDVCRSRADVLRSRADVLCAGELLQQQLQQLLQTQVPPDQVLQAQVLQAPLLPLELLRSGPDLLRSRADLRRSDLRRADLRRSGCRQLLQLVCSADLLT